MLLYIAAAPVASDARVRGQPRAPVAGSLVESLATGARLGGALLGLLRIYLLVAYATTGYGKLLLTPAWASGTAFEYLARSHLRQAVPVYAAAAIAVASKPLSALVLLIECGLPIAELASLLKVGGERARRRFAHLCAVGWLMSAAMQALLLLLTPLTDVYVGTVLFHAALLDVG